MLQRKETSMLLLSYMGSMISNHELMRAHWKIKTSAQREKMKANKQDKMGFCPFWEN